MKKSTRKVSKKRKITAQDLFNLRIATAVSLSSDETKIAYTVERMDEKENKYFSNIFLYDLSTSQSSQFTFGNHSDSKPIWSPDNKQIAFVSSRDKKVGIYTMAVEGGSEKKIIELDGAITNLQWSLNCKELIFCLRYNDSHYIEDEKKKKEPPVFRHITKLFYRLDGAGFLPQDTFQIYKLNLSNSKLTQLTKGKRDNIGLSLSPDGRFVTYASNRSKDPDIEFLREDLFILNLRTGKERLVAAPAGPKANPQFSPNGKFIAYQGHDNPDDGWGVTNIHIWKVGVNGPPKAKDLMPKFDRMAVDQSITDSSDVHGPSPIIWSGDSKKIFFLSSDTGVTNLYYVPAGGGKPTRIFAGNCHVKDFSISGKSSKAALIYADLNNPGDIVISPTKYNGEKKAIQLTELNKFLTSEVKISKTKAVMFKSFDGTKVQGFMTLPPDFKPTKKYPSILNIHGGPQAQYAFSFFHEMQYWAAKGYVVFYTNPRGGSGRGELWSEAISGGWGDLDYKDCMAAADYMEAQRFIHPKKISVTGGSYGGYMTNWMIGRTHRFASAVTQRSVVDLRSFYGSSDIGWTLNREFEGHPWENEANYKKCSPLTYFKKVKTPVLIIHSEQDLRCHIEQAEQMFTMLKVLKKKVEMVRFPEEPHGLSRHGRPDRRIARLDWIVSWFDKYGK